MKIICYLFFCFVLLVQSIAMGDSPKGEKAIYFCHRDIDSYIKLLDMFGLSYVGTEERDVEDDLNNKTARNVSKNLEKPLFHFRHCFFLMADKIEEYPQQNKILVSLKEIQTRGYGKAGMIEKQAVSGGEDKEIIQYKALSCVPIIKDNENDRMIVSKQLGYEHVLPHLYSVWGELLNLMDREERANYNTVGNNCCTASFYITAELIGYARAIKLVDPVKYNLLGMGVFWGGRGPGIFDDQDFITLGEVTDSTMSIARKIWRMVRAEEPSQLPESGKEDKDDNNDGQKEDKPEL